MKTHTFTVFAAIIGLALAFTWAATAQGSQPPGAAQPETSFDLPIGLAQGDKPFFRWTLANDLNIQSVNASNIVLGQPGLSSLGAETSSTGPIQWLEEDGGNGHWYEAIHSSVSWQEAKVDAQSRGGYLATITSSAEPNPFIQGGLLNLLSVHGSVEPTKQVGDGNGSRVNPGPSRPGMMASLQVVISTTCYSGVGMSQKTDSLYLIGSGMTIGAMVCSTPNMWSKGMSWSTAPSFRPRQLRHPQAQFSG